MMDVKQVAKICGECADTHKISAKSIQRILRHKNLRTTELYIQNINNDLKSTINLLSNGGVLKIHKSHTRESKKGAKLECLAPVMWRPQRDLNSCRRRERPVSWTWLDDGDGKSIMCWWVVRGSNARLSD